jgi:hypothetical protein
MIIKLWAVMDRRSRTVNTGGLGVLFDPNNRQPSKSVGCHFIALFHRKKHAVEACAGWRGAKVVPVRIERLDLAQKEASR